MSKNRTYTNRRYLDALAERVLIFDGAMGTSLQQQNLTAEHFGGAQYEGCNDYLVLTYPQAVEKVHRAFLEAGVDVIETDTFRSNRITLREYGLQDKVTEINRAAAQLARRLADEYEDSHPRFVAGSIGPTGKLPSADDPDLSDVTFAELADVFREQAAALIEGGVDLLLIETSQDILEVKAAIHGILRAFGQTGQSLPIQAQVTLDTTGRMLFGTDIAAALTILEGLPIDVIGLNCSTGPEHMRQPIEFLGKHAPLPVSCIPNAGLPINVDGEAVYPLEPEPFAEALAEFIEKHHINVVGGCCGTTPAHLRALVERVHGRRRPPRPVLDVPRLASGIRAFHMRQDPPPLLIGERCNAQGSRRFKRLLLAEDWDGVLEVARQQVDSGAHALDISVAVTERQDEAELMRLVVRKLITAGIDVPLVFDTTDPDVMESGLQTAPGRCLLNSTHLESGRKKADRVFALARQYNAAVLVLTIDEQGMAKTARRKLEVARKLYRIAVHEHGLQPGDLVFDDLTFTLATGEAEYANSARETLEGIRLIKKELPGVFTSLGISNVSFGLNKAARHVINSVFLFHAVKAGLDMAIVNPAHIKPYADIPENERQLAEDLIFNRRPDALERVIAYFEGKTADTSDQPADPTAGLSLSGRLHWRIVHRQPGAIGASPDVETDIDALVEETAASLSAAGNEKRSQAAVHVLNHVLLPAMKEVGDKFGAGELILPFVLQSAEVMKRAVARLETYLERQDGATKGTLVLATVYGDVHDIGKNLVKTILGNNGYTVIDLGKQVPAETIIRAAEEHHADAIGLSALLVSTSKQMPLIVNELHRRGQHVPVLIGGAAINRRFGRRINRTADGELYPAGVFYCKDAFEGLETMESLCDEARRPVLMKALQREVAHELNLAARPKKQAAAPQRSRMTPISRIPQPPSWGARVVRSIPLEAVFPLINKKELFRLSWGAKNTRGAEWEALRAEFEDRLARMQRAALQEGWLQPRAVYGYWPCQAAGNDLLLYAPDDPPKTEIARFHFPRQPDGDGLCLADYFAPQESGLVDVVALQVVTVGQAATEKFAALQADGQYSEAYFVHGLAVQTAEATAEYLHRHIRRELGLDASQGKRYSWGYPAIPDLDGHRVVFGLLPAERELGMALTAAWQLVPEQSTAAIIVHHPAARYFSIGQSRVEQLLAGAS